MKRKGSFFTGDKLSKLTDDKMRINVYPSGIVTAQLPGEPHSIYASGLPKGFSSMTPSQMSEYTFNLLKKKS